MRIDLRFGLGVLLAGGLASAQAPLSPAPHRQVTTVSPPDVRANEPSIEGDATDLVVP